MSSSLSSFPAYKLSSGSQGAEAFIVAVLSLTKESTELSEVHRPLVSERRVKTPKSKMVAVGYREGTCMYLFGDNPEEAHDEVFLLETVGVSGAPSIERALLGWHLFAFVRRLHMMQTACRHRCCSSC